MQTYLTQKLADKFSEQFNTKIHVGSVNIAFFNKVIIEDFWAEDNNQDTLVYVNRMVASVDSFSIKRKIITYKNISFNNSRLFITIDSTGKYNYRFPEISSNTKNDSIEKWRVFCDDFVFRDADFYYESGRLNQNNKLSLNNINFSVKDFKFEDDSLSFILKDFSLKGSNNFSINNFSAGITSYNQKTILNNINLESTRSTISNARVEFIYSDTTNTSPFPSINLFIEHSQVSFKDLAIFIPVLDGMDQVFEFSGNIYGSLTDLKGKDITLQTGQNTVVNCNFYANGLPDLNNIYLFFDLTHFQTDFTDLSKIKLPKSSAFRYFSFPESFYQTGLISYKGNFTGFLTDFVAYGNIESQMGNVGTDLSFKPAPNGKLELEGKIVTTDFKLGELFKNPDFGEISFDGEMKGEYDKIRNHIQGTFQGGISDFNAYGYIYKNLTIDGIFDDKNFDGKVSINDPNLALDFTGKLHLNPKIPEFDFNMSLRKADLVALKMDTRNKLSGLSFIINANFVGSNIDNLNGFINFENGSYRNSNGEITFRDMKLKTETLNGSRTLTFNSDFFDAKIQGQYNLRTLPPSFKYILSKYLPALKDEGDTTEYHNNFEFTADVKNIDKIFLVFKPDISIKTPFSVKGKIDTDQNLLSLDGTIPGISTQKFSLKDISFHTITNNSYSAKIKVGQLQSKSGFNFYNITLNSDVISNQVDTRLTWNNFHLLSYSGEINTSTKLSGNWQNLKAEIQVKPSKFYVADSLWNINPGSIVIDSNSLYINNIKLSDSIQSLTLNGKISKNNKDRLTLKLDNIYLEHLENYLEQEPTLKGVINGNIELEDLYGNKAFYSDLNITGLNYLGQDMGNVLLVNKWDNLHSVINTELKVQNNDRNQLIATGFYDPAADSFEFNAFFDSLSIVILEQVIGDPFTNYQGHTSGHLKIYGKPDNILIDGTLMGKNVSFTVDYTKVNYHFSDSVYFKGNKIIFDNIKIKDELNNQGVFNGTLTHQNFEHMIYDLRVSSPKILAMNTTPKDNGQFYGKVIANGNFYVTGKGLNINLDGDGKTLLGTEVNISLDYEQDAEQYDFIRFVNKKIKDKEEVVFANDSSISTNLNLRIEVTPEAKAQLIYNSQIGDVIKGQGEGVLQFDMDNNGDITIYGTYNIVQGDYLFTLKNIINKKFTIEPGGSINWSGDPYNAKIDIEAIYKLKASIYELLANNNPVVDQTQNSSSDLTNVDKSQRIPVECKILLTDNLLNPTIKFGIDFPMVETRLVDELQQYFNTDEEMNKQIFSLVVLGQFYTPQYLRGSYEATNSSSYLIGSTASELFSNQASNWLSQLSNNVDIGVNYRPGNQITKDEIELALSKEIFNDRVTLNGNIGNNAHPNGNNNSQIVGDFDLKVKITNNGKIQLKAFNRSNNNLIYETSPYTQGIGLTFKEEYNTFDELFKKLFTIFRNKKNNKKSSVKQ